MPRLCGRIRTVEARRKTRLSFPCLLLGSIRSRSACALMGDADGALSSCGTGRAASMTRSRCPIGAVAVVVALGSVAECRAENIRWSYDWSPKPRLVRSDGDGTGGVAFTDEP